MSDQALRSKLIRLAHQKPELRPHLLPLIKTAYPATDTMEMFLVRGFQDFCEWTENEAREKGLAPEDFPKYLMDKMNKAGMLVVKAENFWKLLASYNAIRTAIINF